MTQHMTKADKRAVEMARQLGLKVERIVVEGRRVEVIVESDNSSSDPNPADLIDP